VRPRLQAVRPEHPYTMLWKNLRAFLICISHAAQRRSETLRTDKVDAKRLAELCWSVSEVSRTAKWL
jgi:hypothetical protein